MADIALLVHSHQYIDKQYAELVELTAETNAVIDPEEEGRNARDEASAMF